MLTAHVERYISLRQTLGFKLRNTARRLQAFARFATARNDTHIRASTAVAWAAEAPSPSARHIRLRDVVHLARFLHAEASAHEVPPSALFPAPKVRPLPYIYAPEEVAQIVEAAGRLRRTYPLRREVYATLFGLIAATGLRVSEALDLRFDDLQPNGALLIRRTKFGKSRLVPLHPTVTDVLDRYLDRRRKLAVTDDHVFLSAGNRRIAASMVHYTFRRVVRLAGRRANAAMPNSRSSSYIRNQVPAGMLDTSRVSLSSLRLAGDVHGHTDIVHTYWYLEATPELMTDIATAAEALVAKGDA